MSDVMPWEKDGEEFNAEVAKNLILNLRAENKNLKADKAQLVSERDAVIGERDSALSTVEEQKATLLLAQEDISGKESELSSLTALRAKEHMLVDKGLPLNFVKFIPDGDEETMTSAVEELVSLRGSNPASVGVDPAQVAEPAQDPQAAAVAFFDELMN